MLSGAVLATNANAQSAPSTTGSSPPAATAPTKNAPAPTDTNAANQSAGGIQEVIVTAEKRSQSLQTVPVAVSAFTSQTRDLIGINSTKDLTNYTPGLTYSASLDRITLRGIGRFTNNLGSDPGIANYGDGVYTTFAVASGEDPLFVDRVEVLRGPQGTLYGRNSIGGAINVISKQPLETFQGELRASYANYNHYAVLGYITGPLSFMDVGPLHDWAYRISAEKEEQTDGWFKNISGKRDEGNVLNQFFGEIQLKGKVGEHLDLWAKFNRTGYDNAAQPSLVHAGYSNATPDPALFPSGSLAPSAAFAYTPGAANPVFFGPAIFNPALNGNHRTFNTNTQFGDTVSHNNNFDFQAVYHLPGVDVKYLGGWEKYHYDQVYDYDGTNVLSYQVPLQKIPTAANFGLGSTCAASQFGFTLGLPGTAPCQAATIYPNVLGYYAEHKEFYSHEVDFASTGNGPIQWLAGLYYYQEQYSQPGYLAEPDQKQVGSPAQTLLGTPAAPNPNRYLFYTNIFGRNSSTAGFGQVDWKFAPTWKLTAGVRYSSDDKHLVEQQREICYGLPACLGGNSLANLGTLAPAIDITTVADPSPAGTPGVIAGSFTRGSLTNGGIAQRALKDNFSATTGTLGLEWQPDRQTLAYAKYSRGFKAGGFSPGPTGTMQTLPETGSEHVDAFEIGLKETWNRTLQTNISAFYYDYKGAQIPVTVVPQIGQAVVSTTQFINLNDVHDTGFEIETIWSPIPHLNVLFNYSYLNAEIQKGCCIVDGNDPSGLQPGVKVGSTSPTIDAITGKPVVGQNLSGQEIPGSPKNKVSLNVNYTLQNVFGGDLVGSASYIWKDTSFSSIFNRSYNTIPTQQQVDARLTWTDPTNRYSVVLYGQNLFDDEIIESEGGSRQSTGTIVNGYTLAPPRTYGIQLEYRF